MVCRLNSRSIGSVASFLLLIYFFGGIIFIPVVLKLSYRLGKHRTVVAAVEEYQRIAAAHRNRLVATVRVARELSDQDAQRLSGVLARQYDRPVHLNVVVDPEVIGGIRVEIGDDVIDGTVSSRLDEARRRLAG